MVDKLVDSLNNLIPVFKELETSLHNERQELSIDRRERKNFLRFIFAAAMFMVVATATILILVVAFHETTISHDKNDQKLIDCLYPPVPPTPPNTPTNKLSCYDRRVLISQQEINAILQYQRVLDQDTLDHFLGNSNFQLPHITFSFPSQDFQLAQPLAPNKNANS